MTELLFGAGFIVLFGLWGAVRYMDSERTVEHVAGPTLEELEERNGQKAVDMTADTLNANSASPDRATTEG